MRGPYFDRILTSMTLALMLAAPVGAFAQDSNEPAATFNERFPADQTSTRPPLETPDTEKEQNVRTTTRIVSAKRAPVAGRCPGALVPRCWDRGATG